jgi:hypothetical protein
MCLALCRKYHSQFPLISLKEAGNGSGFIEFLEEFLILVGQSDIDSRDRLIDSLLRTQSNNSPIDRCSSETSINGITIVREDPGRCKLSHGYALLFREFLDTIDDLGPVVCPFLRAGDALDERIGRSSGLFIFRTSEKSPRKRPPRNTSFIRFWKVGISYPTPNSLQAGIISLSSSR